MDVRVLYQDEMEAAAAVHRTAFDNGLSWLAGRHTAKNYTAFYTGHVFTTCRVWGALSSNRLVGIIAFREEWIDHLYVLPTSQARGVGTALLDRVKAIEPHLLLWTFQRNTVARRFYEKNSFKAVEQTDGSANEEHEPDVLYEWRPAK